MAATTCCNNKKLETYVGASQKCEEDVKDALTKFLIHDYSFDV
jgi:hypothetical protein